MRIKLFSWQLLPQKSKVWILAKGLFRGGGDNDNGKGSLGQSLYHSLDGREACHLHLETQESVSVYGFVFGIWGRGCAGTTKSGIEPHPLGDGTYKPAATTSVLICMPVALDDFTSLSQCFVGHLFCNSPLKIV